MGKFQEGSFRAIQEYFQQKNCRFCSNPFAADGIQLLRQEPGMLVVRVGCLLCGRPLGVAIVGTRAEATNESRKPFGEWTKRDQKRFSGLPAINYDDVLEAHQFLASLGPDWSKHLPCATRVNRAVS